jgi:hypothetical protein
LSTTHIPPDIDQLFSKDASAFAKAIKVADYNPLAMAHYAYYEGRRVEYLRSEEKYKLSTERDGKFHSAGYRLGLAERLKPHIPKIHSLLHDTDFLLSQGKVDEARKLLSEADLLAHDMEPGAVTDAEKQHSDFKKWLYKEEDQFPVGSPEQFGYRRGAVDAYRYLQSQLPNQA